MKLEIDIPDATKCVNIALVYDERDVMVMASTMIGTDELCDGKVVKIPKSLHPNAQ